MIFADCFWQLGRRALPSLVTALLGKYTCLQRAGVGRDKGLGMPPVTPMIASPNPLLGSTISDSLKGTVVN